MRAQTPRFRRPQGALRLETFMFYWTLRALRGRLLMLGLKGAATSRRTILSAGLGRSTSSARTEG